MGQQALQILRDGSFASIAKNTSNACKDRSSIAMKDLSSWGKRKSRFIVEMKSGSRDLEASVAESASNVLSLSPPLHSNIPPRRDNGRASHSIKPCGPVPFDSI